MDLTAPSMAKTEQRFRTVTTIGYFTAFAALGLTYASLGPTLTDLAAAVGTDLTHISYGFTARGLGYLVGSVVGGRLYDIVRGHPVVAGALLVTALLMALIPLAPTLWLLIGMLFALGMFQGALDVGGNTLLVWVHRDKVAPYMNALHFFFGVGAFLSPIIIAQAVVVSGGIRWAYWVLALLVLPVSFVMLRLESPKAPSDEADAAAAAGTSPDNQASRRQGRFVALLAVFFFLYVGAESSLGGWISTYARTTGVGDAVTAAYLTSAFWGAITLGRFLSIPISARYTPRQVLAGDLIGCLVSVAVLFLWPGVPVATWIGTFGAGLAMASIFPTALSLAERHLTVTGTITSLFFVGGSLGGMSVPWVIGQLFERLGPQVTTIALVSTVGLACAVFALIVVHTRRSERA